MLGCVVCCLVLGIVSASTTESPEELPTPEAYRRTPVRRPSSSANYYKNLDEVYSMLSDYKSSTGNFTLKWQNKVLVLLNKYNCIIIRDQGIF